LTYYYLRIAALGGLRVIVAGEVSGNVRRSCEHVFADLPYTELEYRQAMTLVAQGVSDYYIAKQNGN
jgi:hypothetical protein